MITIIKGQSNEVWLTLAENTTITNANYLFVFVNDMTKKSVVFVCDYESKAEYAVFNIVESNTPNPLEGVVSLNPSGFWRYTIREQESATNLNPLLSGEIVEVGKVQVLDTPYTNSYYTQQSSTNEVFVNGK